MASLKMLQLSMWQLAATSKENANVIQFSALQLLSLMFQAMTTLLPL